jgi:hypothetical protein
MPPYARAGKPRRIIPRAVPRKVKGRRCEIPDCGKFRREACRCDRCQRHCRALCHDPRQRGGSACGHCAFCLGCKRVFSFEVLTVDGPDLCPQCVVGG